MAHMRINIFILSLWVLAMNVVSAQSVCLRADYYTVRDGLATGVVNTVMQDRMGYLWLGTQYGLTRFDGYRFVNFYHEERGTRRIENVRCIIEDTVTNSLIMLGNDYKTLRFDLQQMAFTDAGDAVVPVLQITEEERAARHRAHALGVKDRNMTHRHRSCFYLPIEGGWELYATIDNGLYIYNPHRDELAHYTAGDERPLIQSDYINGVLKDRSGCVWLATTYAGLCRLDCTEDRLLHHTITGHQTGNNERGVRSFSSLGKDEVAISTMDGSVYRYSLLSGDQSLIGRYPQRVYATATDNDGHFWVGTRGAGVWVDGEPIDKAYGIDGKIIFDILFDDEGYAWIASLDGGVERVCFGDTALTASYLPNKQVHEIDLDAENRLWIAAEDGVYVKEGKHIEHIYEGGRAVCITHTADGTVWVGCMGNGVLRIQYDGTLRELTALTVDDGLANNSVSAIVGDGYTGVMAATEEGLSAIRLCDNTIHNIYSSSGIMSDTYNLNAIFMTADGRVLAGNQLGFVELRPYELTNKDGGERADYPTTTITSVTINDVPLYMQHCTEQELEHDKNNLLITFSAFEYLQQQSVIYSYWMEGVDYGWRESTKESSALYSNLVPGHYRFHVRASIAGGPWGEPATCEVRIKHPWWWTWQARVLYVLAISLFVWYEVRQYRQRLSLRRQLDQRLTALYAVEVLQRDYTPQGTNGSDGWGEMGKQGFEEAGVAAAEREDTNRDASSELEENSHEQHRNQRDRDFLIELDHLILQNLLYTDLDVNFIAQKMCVSYSTLHRRIKSLTGMTVNEYVRKHRLAKAMQLLRDGKPVSEVAMQCGFNSPSYFTRCFKSEYGILPSEA